MQFTSLGQETYPLLDIKQFQDKFMFGELRTFNLEELNYDYNSLYQLNDEEYYCFMQRPLNYSSADVNPYFLFSIQSFDSNLIEVTILHHKEALYFGLSLLTYDQNGKKLSETPVSIVGGDGAWWFKEKTEIQGDSILLSSYFETELESDEGAKEVWLVKEAKTNYKRDETGAFRLVSTDTIVKKDTKIR